MLYAVLRAVHALWILTAACYAMLTVYPYL